MHGEVRMEPPAACTLIATCSILHNIAKTMAMPEVSGVFFFKIQHLCTCFRISLILTL